MPLFNRSKPNNADPAFEPMAIVAGGQTYQVSSYTDATRLSLLRQQWQLMAYDLYDTEGHLFYATNYVGSALARVKLVAAKKPKVDKELSKPEIILDGPIADAVKDIRSPRGGQTGLLRQIGRNIFLAGEVWLVATEVQLPDGSRDQSWDACSIEELIVHGTSTTFLRRRTPGSMPEPLPPGTLTIRIWKEHPRYGEWADSGVRSCIEVLEKIVILNRAEKAVARSRIAGAGILAIPQELAPPNWQSQEENGGNPMESNPLWKALAESMTAPLQNDGHPASVVPLLLVGPGEVINKMKYEPMERSFNAGEAAASIQNGIEQVANTLELPKEILLGQGQANHWTAWAIREDVFQAHIQPLVEMICQALTHTYLRQALSKLSPAQLKAAGVDDIDDIIVWYDASQLVVRPDKGDKAVALHDRFAISDEALRRESGFSDDDAPGKEEYAKRVGLKVADPKMALTGKPPEQPAAPPKGGPGGAPPGAPGGVPAPEASVPTPPTQEGRSPRTLNPGRGKSPQGPKAKPPLQPSERRVAAGPPALTASLDQRAGTELGLFDLRAIRKLHRLATKHTSAITAASGLPSDYIPDFALNEFDNVAASLWGDFALFTGSTFAEPIVTAAIVEAKSLYQQLLETLIGRKIFDEPLTGEFIIGSSLQFGDIRPVLAALGGGTTDVTVQLQGGIGTGKIFSDAMSAQGISLGNQRIWLYGLEEQPRRVFNGHLQMDGLVFEQWDDDALTVSPQDRWLRTQWYYPGDHFGCSCIVAPYVPNFGEPFNIEFLPSQ